MSWNILNLYFKKRYSTKKQCSNEIPYWFSASRIDEDNDDGEDGVNDDDNDHSEDLGNDDGSAGFGGDGKDGVTMILIVSECGDLKKFFGDCSIGTMFQ